jgi:hypothetical protein
LLQGRYKVKAKKKLETFVSNYLNEEEQKTSSPKETLVQPSKIQRIEEKGKAVDGSSKLIAWSRKTVHFTSPGAKIAYRNNFFKKNVLGEREVLVSDLSNPIFAFIEDMFKKIQWRELNKKALTPYIEVVREFYANCESFNLDDYSITSTIKIKTLKLSLTNIRKLYKLLEMTDPNFPYKGIRALFRLR